MSLSKYFTTDNVAPTHYNYDTKDKLKLQQGLNTRFWFNYCDEVYADNNKLFYAEVPERFIPLFINFSVSYKNLGSSVTPFDDILIKNITICIQKIIKKHYITDVSDSELIAFILETPMYLKNGFSYYELKFQFPRCKVSVTDINNLIRPELIKLLDEEVIINNFNKQPSENWTDIICAYNYPEPILLYHSTLNEHKPGNSLVTIYDPTGEEVDLETLSEFFRSEDHVDLENKSIHDKISLKNIETDYYWYLPIILSCGFFKHITPMKSINDIESDYDFDNDQDLNTQAKIANIALSMLSLIRYKEQSYWLTIGKALYNIYEGSEKGLEVWLKHSTKVIELKDNTIETLNETYNDFSRRNPYTELTLLSYAEEDNPKAYNEWHSNYCNDKIMESCETGTAGSIARAVFCLYWSKYAYFNGAWYELKNTHLERMIREGPGIAISSMRGIYNQYLKKLCDEPQHTNRKKQKDLDESKSRVTKIMLKLDDPSFLYKIVQSLKLILAKKHEKAIINHDWKIMAVANLVLESQNDNKPMLKRKGKLEDYCTMWSDTIYDGTLSEKSNLVITYRKYMKQLLHYAPIIQYIEDLFSKAMRSHNLEKKVPNLFGPPNAGKTVFKALMETVFGTYSYTWPTTNLTGRRTQGDTASPTMAAADDKKLVWAEEPEDADTVNEGMYRQESGGGKRHTRRLNENGGEGTATAMYLIMSNNKIRITPKPENKTRYPFIAFNSIFMDSTGDQLNGYVYPESEEERVKKSIYLKKNT